MKNLSRRKFLRGAAVAVPAAAIAVPLAVKAVEAKVEAPFELTEENFFTHTITGAVERNYPSEPFVATGEIEFNDKLLDDGEEVDFMLVEPHDDEEETYAFGLEGDPENPVTLWCEKQEDGKFWVINGHWVYEHGNPRWPGSVLTWKGVAPFGPREYNEAMSWIRDQIAA